MPACPNCKATVNEPEKVYRVVVEPEQGERGIVNREVGMYHCPRCDTTFPRVLGRVRYLLVPESEYTRLKKETSESKAKADHVSEEIEVLKKEKIQREEWLNRQLKDSVIAKLEAEVKQLEKHVRQLKTDKSRLESELQEK